MQPLKEQEREQAWHEHMQERRDEWICAGMNSGECIRVMLSNLDESVYDTIMGTLPVIIDLDSPVHQAACKMLRDLLEREFGNEFDIIHENEQMPKAGDWEEL